MENVNINAWVDMKNDNAVLLDVRTIEEFNEGHITGALNIDVFSPNFQAEVEKLDTSKDYYTSCTCMKERNIYVYTCPQYFLIKAGNY